MKNYYELISELYSLDRCHSGPEMELAYQKLNSFYRGSRLLKFNQKEIFWWIMPPFWSCDFAELKGPDNKIYASKKRNNLELFTYSPSINKLISFKNLKKHILYDKKKPDSLIFHFQNQYRHWKPIWGFSIPYNIYQKMPKGDYKVNIKSKFNFKKNFTQSDFLHKGRSKKEYIFLGHFDHPSQVNDGLIGCIAAYEIIKKLKNVKTKFSYRAFASIENVGSVAYLNSKKINKSNIIEGLFLTTCGINNNIKYSQSFYGNSKIDRIVKLLFKIKGYNKKIYKHRELIGNDENIFDSVGYNIPTGTLLRHPHKNYHTNKDNMQITSKTRVDEIISLVMEIINILEKDSTVSANYKGIPSLSNPKIDLYFNDNSISGIFKKNKAYKKSNENFSEYEIYYLNKNNNLLHEFMTNLLRMADGKHTIFDISEKTSMPFNFVYNYCLNLKRKKILKLTKVV